MIPLIFPKVPQSSLGILRVWNRHNLTFKQVKNVEAEEVPNFGLRVQAVYKHPRNKNIMFNILLMEEILHRGGHMGQYVVTCAPAPPFQCCLLKPCAPVQDLSRSTSLLW